MRNEYIPKVLKEYRKKNHYTVTDVALMLRERSIDVAPKTIYGWESGQANPSADALLTLCELYNVTDILSAFGYAGAENFHVTASERALIESYRRHPELQEAVDILLGRRSIRRVRSRDMQPDNEGTSLSAKKADRSKEIPSGSKTGLTVKKETKNA